MKSSIGSKIFGLAIFLLCLTLSLSGFLLWQVSSLQRELLVMAEKTIPLSETLAQLNEIGLRRRIAFERQIGALLSGSHGSEIETFNARILKESPADYEQFTEEIQKQILRARELLGLHFANEADPENLGQIKALLEETARVYPLITEQAWEVLSELRENKVAEAVSRLTILNEHQSNLLQVREKMQTLSAQRALKAGERQEERNNQIQGLTISAGISLILLGLVVARIVTVKLTAPVRSLIEGVQDVRNGNLDLHLKVIQTDEIGVLTDAFNHFIAELRAKVELERTFGKYLDPRVIEHMALKSTDSMPAESRVEMTVGFSDLVGFSHLSEQLTPKTLVTLLNRHFTLQSEAVYSQLGVVDKFIGDAIMAFWGPPFTAPEAQAQLACDSALAQLAAADVLRRETPDLTGLRRNTPLLDIRIGLSTGEVILGNLGSEKTRSFTVIGDAVNLGSRIEGANRFYGTRILVSQRTAEMAGTDFLFREIDLLTAKGKSEPAKIFELMGRSSTASEAQTQLANRFSEGLAAYRSQDWVRAESAFAKCGSDGPSQVFLQRIAKLRENPPPPDWAGVWKLDEK
jgi:adenylate cyclase